MLVPIKEEKRIKRCFKNNEHSLNELKEILFYIKQIHNLQGRMWTK